MQHLTQVLIFVLHGTIHHQKARQGRNLSEERPYHLIFPSLQLETKPTTTDITGVALFRPLFFKGLGENYGELHPSRGLEAKCGASDAFSPPSGSPRPGTEV